MAQETTSLPVGLLGTLSCELVPRTELTFGVPDPATTRALQSPNALTISVPIKGTCLNFPNRTKCQLSWLIKKGEIVTVEGPVQAELVLDSSTTFHLEVAGAAPTIDIIQHRLVGSGWLGFKVVPDFPHASPKEFPPTTLRFDIALGFDIEKPAGLCVGSKVVFRPRFARVFDDTEIRLDIEEREPGETAPKDVPDVAGAHDWAPRDRRAWTWPIGFTDTSFSRLALIESNHVGNYDFAWVLKASSDGGRTFVRLVENTTDFVGVRKPKLDAFKLDFRDGWLEDEVVARGHIAHLARGSHLEVDVALVHHDALGKASPPNWREQGRTVRLDDDGSFQAELVSRWIGSSVLVPDPHKVFAIVSVASDHLAIVPSGHTCSIASFIDADEDVHAGFRGSDVVFGSEAEWFCSQEVGNLVKTPAQLIDDALVKRVFYCGGVVDEGAHAQLKEILAGKRTVQKGACDENVTKALERALIFLSYPTGSIGECGVSGGFGPGVNFGLALFLREWGKDQLVDKDGKALTDKELIFASKNNDESREKVAQFPVIVVDKPKFELLLKVIDHSRRTKQVYLGDAAKAVDNLDRIEKRQYLTAAEVVARFRGDIEASVKAAAEKGVTIKPTWLAAFILQETGGIPRPKYEHHNLYSYYTDPRKRGRVVEGESLVTFRECRLRSTSFGLGQLMGSNYHVTRASSAFDLYIADEARQVRMIADYLISVKDQEDIEDALKNDGVTSSAERRLNALARAYNGSGYAKHSYHVHLLEKLKLAKAVW